MTLLLATEEQVEETTSVSLEKDQYLPKDTKIIRALQQPLNGTTPTAPSPILLSFIVASTRRECFSGGRSPLFIAKPPRRAR